MNDIKCDLPCQQLIRLSKDFEDEKKELQYSLRYIKNDIKEIKDADLKMHTILKEHMDSENVHHLKVAEHMAATNIHMKNSASKEDLATTNGKLKTLWILGSVLFLGYLAITGLLVEIVRNDIKNSIVNASKANYSGLKKVIHNEVTP